ncbi:MAG: hypothetical protein HY749_16185 [Gammaproteobacteria bacterium]|nr:hypothetical protein [Gammaproteobacteria bacterium]
MNHPNRNWRARLREQAAALGPDLVAAWQAVTLAHGTLSDGLSLLNVATDGAYTLSRLGEWRNARRSIPEGVQHHMRRIVLEVLLGDSKTAAAVESAIAPPQSR